MVDKKLSAAQALKLSARFAKVVNLQDEEVKGGESDLQQDILTLLSGKKRTLKDIYEDHEEFKQAPLVKMRLRRRPFRLYFN